MSSEVKRYTRCGMSIVEDKKGGWVEYSDYAALEAVLGRVREEHDKAWDTAGTILEKLSKANAELDEARAELQALKAEVEDDCAIRRKMADILNRTAIAIRGPAPELTRYGWADLPERAAKLRELALEVQSKGGGMVSGNYLAELASEALAEAKVSADASE